MLYYMGRVLHDTRRLAYCTVVATSMSNFGLEKALRGEEIRLLRTDVGDRYVLQALKEGGFVLGGEQSGHVILMHYAPTGDGILTALTLTRMWRGGGGDLDEALAQMPRYPQVLKNLKVREKPAIAERPVLAAAVRAAEEALAGDGRVVVRYSGTEPLLRVMVEGPERQRVEQIADSVLEAFRREVGA
jgi:phosphoglucosamine mutase